MDKSKYTAIADAVLTALARSHELPAWQQDWRQIPNRIDNETNAAPALMQTIYKRLGVTVIHTDGSACPVFKGGEDDDLIEIPHQTAFSTQEGYLAAAFHELTHWTGGPKRTYRPKDYFIRLMAKRFQTPEAFEEWFSKEKQTEAGVKFMAKIAMQVKALEEMTAELGSAFMMTAHNVPVNVANTAQYLASWATEFAVEGAADTEMDFMAAVLLALREARKATEWMLERTNTVERTAA